MQSILPLVISSLVLAAILLLAILATIIWLQRLQSQTNRETQTFLSNLLRETLTTLSESQAAQLSAIRGSSEMTLERLSSQLSSAQTQFLQHLQGQTRELATMMSTSVNQATSSVSSTATQLAELLASAQAMNATKDPIAFQQVRGAAFPFAGDNVAEPYTSTEELAQQDAEQAAALRVVDQSLATIMNLSGVQDERPYPAAGSGFGPAPAAP
jgi:nitrogen fixation/metabolism regulation signal transduction histidine kinase